jgi:site-specific recombinase XerD
MSPQAVQQVLKSIVDKSGMPHWIHIHTFRHSFVVNCLIQGMTINTLKEILGHANVENTMIYLKVFQPEIREQFSRITF